MNSRIREVPIAVVGATGHTARFVLDELERRGFATILVARDAAKLATASAAYPRGVSRLARLDDPASLDAALAGVAAVINCAGPFLDTAHPVVDAALRAAIPYLDLAAEQAAVQAMFARDAEARRAGITVLPAAAFFGGLADLLATVAANGAPVVDEIAVAVALDRWHPTAGTRRTGARNTVPRVVVRAGAFETVADPQPAAAWQFQEPFGDRRVVQLPFSETITLAHHLGAATIISWISQNALDDVRDAATPPPQATDARGRSAQQFVMDVRVRTGDAWNQATACGRDIYAASAPIVVEALERVLAGDRAHLSGVRALGEIFDAAAFLSALSDQDGLHVASGPSRVAIPVYSRAS